MLRFDASFPISTSLYFTKLTAAEQTETYEREQRQKKTIHNIALPGKTRLYNDLVLHVVKLHSLDCQHYAHTSTFCFISVYNQPATQGQLSLPSLRGR